MDRSAASAPDGLSAADDRFLARLARAIEVRGLTAPAVLALECLRPTAFLGGQAMRLLSPFVKLVAGGEELKNPYGIIAVNPERFPDVNHAAVQRLIDWFGSDRAHALIAGYRVDGEQLFHPVIE